MKNLNELSTENLERIQKVLKIILDELELQEINRLAGNKIPLKRFEKEDIFYEEVVSILNTINKEEKKSVLEVLNESLEDDELKDWDNSFKSLKELERFENERIGLKFLGFSKKDLKENIILIIKNLNRLKEIKEEIDRKLKEVAKIRAKEIRRQFEEEERIREIVKEEQTEREIPKTSKRRDLIIIDKTGDFYYKNKLIKFENKDAIYYLIFECLYEKGELDGFCSYETIDKYLVEHGKERYDDNRQITDRIKNGVMNLFRFSNLPAKAPDGKEIIQKVRGKGIILYNPSL